MTTLVRIENVSHQGEGHDVVVNVVLPGVGENGADETVQRFDIKPGDSIQLHVWGSRYLNVLEASVP